MSKRSWIALAVAAVMCTYAVAGRVQAAAGDIVVYAADVSVMQGNWSRISSSTGAGNQLMNSADASWSKTDSPAAFPSNYFEANFSAPSNTLYHVWLRLRAAGNSKWNDSVFVQFSDSVDSNGSAIYRIGSGSGLSVNLQSCNGCGLSGWGWLDGSYWLQQETVVKFTGNSHTVRVQTREDGVQIDQILLSPSAYLWSSPGSIVNDSTVIAQNGGSGGAGGGGGGGGASSPFLGSAVSLPGTIYTQNFDNGGEGVGYHDTSAGNNGGAYRGSDVDLESSADGGNNVGWIVPGEWLNYSAYVSVGGSYNVAFRVASPGQGGTFHLEANGSNVSGSISIPNTGSWQGWATVSKTIGLSAGAQTLRLVMDNNGPSGSVGNINSMTFTQGSGSAPPPPSGSSPFSGTGISLPGTIQAENFDNGGEGVGYHDASPGNYGGAYRSTDVDVETGTGGYNVGYASVGEWLNYRVIVASAGTYTFNFRVASAGQGGTFHLEMDGSNVTGGLGVPNTGGWQSWQTVSKTVTLSGGVQTARLVMDSTGSNGAVGNFESIEVTSGSAPAPPPPPPPPPSGGGGRVRIMTWNIRFGTDVNEVYSLPSQVAFMVAQDPDVIILQEVSTFNEYQPTRYRDLLQQYSGQTWYSFWVPGTGCLTQPGCFGDQILSRLPIADYSNDFVPPSGMGRVVVNVGGVPINVFTIHLEAFNTSVRTSQLLGMMAWTRSYGGPKVVGGDFNSWWGEYWIQQMRTEYSDTWFEYTGNQDGGYTIGNPGVRYDFLFRSLDSNGRMAPINCYVPWTTLSDHRPVVADYQVH